MITSTPKTKPSSEKDSLTETKVKLTVEHPSKTINKTLTRESKAIGNAIIHGPPSRTAKAVLKCKAIKTQVIEQVLRVVSSEVSGLCSKKNPLSCKDDLVKYYMQKLCEEWKERAPVFYAFLLTCSTSKPNVNIKWFPSLALSL